jgi:hypothetical protein
MKRTLKLLFAAVAVVCSAAPALAQFTTVSASDTGGAGHLIANATVYWQAVTGFRIGSSSGQALGVPYSATVTTGAFSLSVPDTSLSDPTYPCYAVTVIDNLTGNTLIGAGLAGDGIHVNTGGAYGCVQPSGSTWSFDSYVPAAPAGTMVVAGPAGATGVINWRGAWAATTAYAKNDGFVEASNGYIVITAYTSGSTFGSTDTANSVEVGTANGVAITPISLNTTDYYVPAGANPCTYISNACSYINSSGNSVRLNFPGSTFTFTGTCSIPNTCSGLFINGTKGILSPTCSNPDTCMNASGGSVFNMGGSYLITMPGNGTTGPNNIEMDHLLFTNWGASGFLQGGTATTVGPGFLTLRDVYGVGQTTVNASSLGIVMYNSQHLTVDDVKIANVNTALSLLTAGSTGSIPGNSEIKGFYAYGYSKTSANGNCSDPLINDNQNLNAFYRLQMNVYSGTCGDGVLLGPSAAGTVIDGVDGEVFGTNVIHVQSSANSISIPECFGTGQTTNTITYDSGATDNHLLSTCQFASIVDNSGGNSNWATGLWWNQGAVPPEGNRYDTGGPYWHLYNDFVQARSIRGLGPNNPLSLYGPDSVQTMTIAAAGTGWAVNDLFRIPGNEGVIGCDGIGKVTAASGGVPSAVSVIYAGTTCPAVTGGSASAIVPSVGTALTVTTTSSNSGVILGDTSTPGSVYFNPAYGLYPVTDNYDYLGLANHAWSSIEGYNLCVAKSSTLSGCLQGSGLTANRTYTAPDASGTLALTSQLPPVTTVNAVSMELFPSMWSICDGTCAGGSGANTPSVGPAQTFNVASPSLNNNSMKMTFTANANTTDVLFVAKPAGTYCAACTKFTYDLWYYPTNSTGVTQHEFDEFTDTASGSLWMFGHQCNTGVWDIWNANTGAWVATSATCSFAVNTWHHLVFSDYRIAGDTTGCAGYGCMYYGTLTVDGTQVYALNTSEPAGPTPGGWANGAGAQFQEDVSTASSGSPVAVVSYYDLVDFTEAQ